MMLGKKIKQWGVGLLALGVIGLTGSASAAEHPVAVDPGEGDGPPSDALVLFDGTGLSSWQSSGGAPAKWKVEDGVATVNGTGSILTRQAFGDIQLHVEWATPSDAEGESQGRGNSGVYLQGRYEIQVLDSYRNETYPDGQAGALYEHFPPLVNASRPPGKWQTYDIIFHAPEVGDDGSIEQPGSMTVFHNGVLIQDNVPVTSTTRAARFGEPARDGTGPLMLQDHNSAVRYRNIWLRKLDAGRATAPLKVHMISGSNEYESEASLKPFKRYLEENYRVDVTASWVSDGAEDLPGVEHIPEADLLLIFTRRMKLPEEDMDVIRNHWQQGKPIVGIRTASHAFRRDTNQHFDHKVLGGNYQGHFGGEAVEVRNEGAAHPVLQDVGEFSSMKLYKAGELAEGATLLQTGHLENGESDAVTWTHRYNGGRMFYTSLGVPLDFENDNFRRMIVNAIFWATHRKEEAMERLSH